FWKDNNLLSVGIEKLIDKYGNNELVKEILSGKYDYAMYPFSSIGPVGPREIEKAIEIDNVFDTKQKDDAYHYHLIKFSGKLKSHHIEIQYPKYTPDLFWKEPAFQKHLVLNSLASKLPQAASFASMDEMERYVFAASADLNTDLPEINNILKIYVLSQNRSVPVSFLDYNEAALQSINPISNEKDLEITLGYARHMIEIVSQINPDKSLDCQKEYDQFKEGIRGKSFPEIKEMLNRLVNYIHKTGEDGFFDILMKRIMDYQFTHQFELKDAEKNAFTYFSNFADKDIKLINLSKDGKINFEFMKVFRALMASFYAFEMDGIVLKDDTLFWSCRFGLHRVSLKADFSESGRGISISFYEGSAGDRNRRRLEYIARVLEKIGFDVIRDDGKDAEIVGLKAKLDKDTGLNNGDDLADILTRTMLVFGTSRSVELNADSGIETAVHNFFSEELYGHWEESRNFKESNYLNKFRKYTSFGQSINPDRYTKPPFKTIQNKFNPILEDLGLEVMADNLEAEYEDNPQSLIDNYFNRPLERAYAEGRVILNAQRQLEKNGSYDVETEIVQELLGKNANKLFDAGALINQIINPGYFNFQEIAVLGGQNTLQTGYIQLENGDYLSVKAIVSKGKTIQAVKAERVSDKGRELLNASQLLEILHNEGYEYAETENIMESDKEAIIENLKQKIIPAKNPEIGAYVTSQGATEQFAGTAVIDSSPDRKKIKAMIKKYPDRAKYMIWIVPYTKPADMEILDQIGAVLTLGGGYTSHAAIEMRNREKMSMVLSGTTLKRDGSLDINAVVPAGEIREDERTGIQTQTGKSEKINIQDGGILLLNRAQGKIEFLDKDAKVEDYETANKAKISKISSEPQKSRTSKTPLDDIKLAEIVKKYDELNPGDKERNGSKGWNLAEMLKKVFNAKGENIIPQLLTIDDNGIRYYLGKRAAEYDGLNEKIEAIINDAGLSAADKKDRIRPLRERIKELIKETYENIESEEHAKGLIALVLEKMDELGIDLSAVRSAGKNEDKENHPFAGMAESKTKVKREDVSKAIAEVFESFYSDKAIDDMVTYGVMVEPALTIQEWVDFKTSGVALLDGDILTINIAYGECKGIVDGSVTPDRLKVRVLDFKKGKFKVIEPSEPATKDWKVETNENGASELKRVIKGVKKRIFTKKEKGKVSEIIRAIGKIKQEFGFAPNVECGFDANDSFKVVQARANTADSARSVIPKELERDYVEGKLISNAYGELEENKEYDVVAEIVKDLLGNKDSRFNTGGVVDHIVINNYDFKFQQVARLGGQNTLYTGYIQLKSGDYLSIKMIKDST
ncbi:MAG: PEP-utilizing enzyme, partial [Endomicrobia bacterium]|nr:PEP-utilizing enzyme [Endomicrobiia bacterium]